MRRFENSLRKILAGILLLAIAVPAEAVTNAVSQPAGFIRVNLDANSDTLLSTPFDAFGPDINSIFFGQLTGETNQDSADVIRKWDAVVGAYTNAYKAGNTGDSSKDGFWFEDFTSWVTSPLTFYPGEGFWIGNKHAATQTVFICGTVVLGDQGSVNFASGFNLFGYSFSSQINLNNTSLQTSGAYGASPVTNSDKISDLVGGQYQNSWLLENAASSNHHKWVDASTNLSSTVLGMGRGYWLQRVLTNGFTWTETRPYANPYPTNGNPPQITGMAVNTAQDEITLAIETTGDSGETIDVYYKDLSSSNSFTSTNWQIAAVCLPVNGASSITWTDAGSATRGKINTVFGRCYLLGRGDVDEDGDGLPSSREIFVYGTNPNLADTDGDGMNDGDEIACGRNPFLKDGYLSLPFVENFETNTVALGDINGQNGWTASIAGRALVQSNATYEGAQALKINSTGTAASVTHQFVSNNNSVVWADYYVKALPVTAPGTASGSASLYFNTNGNIVVYDGLQSGTNKWVVLTNQVSLGTWVRLSVKMDYSVQRWLICLNNAKVADNLGFAQTVACLNDFSITAERAYLDKMNISTNQPSDVSADSDNLPDSWELQYFGNTNQNDGDDPDGDGLSNLQEFLMGTDPTRFDTDGDGVSDGAEVFFGKDPLVADSYMPLPFTENFETNTVVEGSIDGQNGWTAVPANLATVETNVVYEGAQAMLLHCSYGTNVTVQHIFASTNSGVVWVDYYTQVIPAAAPTGTVTGSAVLYFNNEGKLVVYDGLQAGTNKWVVSTNQWPLAIGSWARITIKFDFAAQQYDLWVNCANRGQGIGFASTVPYMNGFSATAEKAYFDKMTISTNIPASLSFDGDSMPDDWEMQYFGNLDQSDSGDYDNDGVSNLQEYLHGTVPTQADTDNDGWTDGQEIAAGTDPLDDTSHPVTISGTIGYSGPQTGPIYVCAVTDPETVSTNLRVAVLSAPGAYSLNLLAENSYWIKAWRDSNGDGSIDFGEAWTIYSTNSMLVTGNVAGVDIILADPDVDVDGLPDWWEYKYFGDLTRSPAEDSDGEGLSNLEEYQLGTDPSKIDTDNDGVSDYVEVRQAFTDPLSGDFNGVVTTLQTVNGSSSTNWLGSWTKDGTAIYARERSGYVDYTITAPSNGVFAVKVNATQHNPLTTQNTFDLSLYVDGALSGRQNLIAAYGTSGTAVFFLSWISAGDHAVRIHWRNLEPNTFLQINSLALQSYGGNDANSNSIPDWLENRQASVSGFAVPAASLVSPVCLEGDSLYQSMLTVSADYIPEGQTQQVIAVSRGLGDGWYANVLLSPSNSTAIQVSDQNGAVTYATNVVWEALNILDGIYTNDFLLRCSDSLKLTASPAGASNGTVTIKVLSGTNIVTNIVTTTDAPYVHLFNSAGTFTVSGSYSNETVVTNLAMTVRVISGGFAADPVCVIGASRTWDCPNMPTNVVVQHDSSLVVTSANLSGGTRFTLVDNTDAAQSMIARISSGGPILDRADVTGVLLSTVANYYAEEIETLSDGSKVVEVVVQMNTVPSDIRMAFHIFVGGVMFEDGTIDKSITAADFDSSGQYRLRFIKGANVGTSVCHNTWLYQGTTALAGY